MDVTSIGSLSTALSQAEVADAVGIRVLKKAMDIQAESAIQLLQAIPAPPAAAVGSTSGGVVDTWA